MSLIEIEARLGGLNTLESLSLAVTVLSRAGVECHGRPISPGALYSIVEVQDRLTNYALCVLKRTGFSVSQDYHPSAGLLPSPPATRARP